MKRIVVPVTKQAVRLEPDYRRVITRPFIVASETRVKNVIRRVLNLDATAVEELLEETLADYRQRHREVEPVFLRHYKEVAAFVPEDMSLNEAQKLLIGAYFTMEYSIESAALFNPSIVLAPDQSGLQPGQARVILSLRAVGEGHVSSVEFRQGVLQPDGHLDLDRTSRFVATPRVKPDKTYDRHLFRLKLLTMGARDPWPAEIPSETLAEEIIDAVLGQLDDAFTFEQLRAAIHHYASSLEGYHYTYPFVETILERMVILARANYEMTFSEKSDISERVVFPSSTSELGGMEDARFVRFSDDGGAQCYMATYTAFDRVNILTQILETEDFRHFKVHTLNGSFSQSKGMAFFPRRVNGQYAILSRVDGENLFLMYSDNMHFWDTAELICEPTFPWEFMHIGNCGSPIETEAGWLILTHGVGAVRRYCIGALLLDLNDPSQVIGMLEQPLLKPEGDEREGYVPNVVYSCGGLIHNNLLILPYAVSDTSTRVATIELAPLLEALTSGRRLETESIQKRSPDVE